MGSRLVDVTPARTLVRLLAPRDTAVIAGFAESVVVQLLSAGLAVDLSTWTDVTAQTSADGGRTWTDRTTAVTTEASGIVTMSLTAVETAAMTAPGSVRLRVHATNGDGAVRCFPDDADLYVTLRVQR